MTNESLIEQGVTVDCPDPSLEQVTAAPVTTISTKNSINIPYSAFSTSKKHIIVFIVAFAGIASTVSANIYFPALNAIQQVMSECQLSCGAECIYSF